MSLALKNKLLLRAAVIAEIRQFFAERQVLEVETPILSAAATTDPYLQSFFTGQYYLQTSPEFAMKRLLAAGSGAIYQICKVFREEEQGRYHNPEFTMLEWYRPDFDHHQLMQEIDDLLQHVLQTTPAQKLTYAEIFEQYLQINPHTDSLNQLQKCAAEKNITSVGFTDDKDTWLQLLMNHCIEPYLGQDTPVFLYDFPASQAALAKIRHDDPPVAERFEVYIQGMELANGFHELTDAQEQEQRFINDLQHRKQLGYPQIPYDQHLIAALKQGLPDCAGVALGVDRLIMIAANTTDISDIISFPIDKM
jgi:elongation factor P--(R)-beta-lysine ligase